MKKTNLLKTGLFALTTALLVACGGGNDSSTNKNSQPSVPQNPSSDNKSSTITPSYPDYDGTEVQGVSETEILIGNTAASTGAFAKVGIPFNQGLNAALKVYNDAGGFNGKTVKLKTYDDEFTADKGLTYTKKLVEEDKIFALVGHFGTNTVGATLDYIKYEKGIPMVYAATGISGLYNEEAKGYERAVMSVQPIYDAEGRVLLARALASTEGGYGLGGKKIGVISTKDDAGKGMLAGIKAEAKDLGVESKITYVTTDAKSGTNHASAVNALKMKQCDVIIAATNQAPLQEILQYMKDGGLTGVKIITSYANANAADYAAFNANGDILNEERELYTAAWLDINDATYFYAPDATNLVGTYLWTCYKGLATALGLAGMYDLGVFGYSAEYWEVAENLAAYVLQDANEWANTAAFELSYNSYALAGYIAGDMFTTGLKRVQEAELELTWKNYIDVMEASPIDILMGGELDYANGKRYGITDLALNKYDHTTATLVLQSGLTSLKDVEANIK